MVNSMQNTILGHTNTPNTIINKQQPAILPKSTAPTVIIPQSNIQHDVFAKFRKIPVVKTELKGHLIRGYHPIDAIKDWGKLAKGFGQALNGESKDYTLGRINGAAVGLGSLGIASVLGFMNKKGAPHNRAMEFVGLMTWLGSMQLWPKLFIGTPLKAMTGVDVNQKYENSYGDRKRVFEDTQYIPFDLFTDEEINKIGNKLDIPVDMPNRREAIENKMKQIATQSNTLWMLTAGLSTPILSSLLADRFEEPVSTFIQERNIASANNKLADLRESGAQKIRRNTKETLSDAINSFNKYTESIEKTEKDPKAKIYNFNKEDVDRVGFENKLSTFRKSIKRTAEVADKALTPLKLTPAHHKPVVFTEQTDIKTISTAFDNFFSKTKLFDKNEIDIVKSIINNIANDKEVKLHQEATALYEGLVKMDKGRSIMQKAFAASFGRMEGSEFNGASSIFARLCNKRDAQIIKALGLPKHIKADELNDAHIIEHLNQLKKTGALKELRQTIQNMKNHYLQQMPSEVVEHFAESLKSNNVTPFSNEVELLPKKIIDNFVGRLNKNELIPKTNDLKEISESLTNELKESLNAKGANISTAEIEQLPKTIIENFINKLKENKIIEDSSDLSRVSEEAVEHFTNEIKDSSFVKFTKFNRLATLQHEFLNKFIQDKNLKALGMESTFVRLEKVLEHVEKDSVDKSMLERIVKGNIPNVTDGDLTTVLKEMFGKGPHLNKIEAYFNENSPKLNKSKIVSGKAPLALIKDALEEVTSHSKWFKRVGAAGLVTLGVTVFALMNFGKANKYNPDPSMVRRDK